MPLFSVITVAKNAGQAIRRTVESVAGQTFGDYEYLVVDGASSDNTVTLARAYAPSGTRIVSERDRGIAQAMNKGIALSRGQLIIHLHAGDEFADAKVLGRVAESYEREGWRWAVGWSDHVDSVRSRVRRVVLKRFDYDVLRYVDYLPHQSTFLSRDVFDEYGLFDETFRIAMDYEYWLRVGRFVEPKILLFVVSKMSVGGLSSNTIRTFIEDRRARAVHCPEEVVRGLLLEAQQIAMRLGLQGARTILPRAIYQSLQESSLYGSARKSWLVLTANAEDPPFEILWVPTTVKAAHPNG